MVTDKKVTVVWKRSLNKKEIQKDAILLNADNPNGILVEVDGFEIFIPLHSMDYFYQKVETLAGDQDG